mgnify:CR=1 FL=1
MPPPEKGTRKPRIAVIGGGTGLSVMLRGLKMKPVDITAIVTVADDGGSSGRLREEMHIPPPGDIRNVLAALADTESLLNQMLSYRFQNGTGLAGHSLGNLILAALTDITGDFVTAVKELSKVLAIRGRVLPAAGQAIVLGAEMADGTVVLGESNIPKAGGQIRRVFIEPKNVEPLPDAVQAIREADCILIGPGSLYTSIMPNLIVPKLAEAIVASRALKIFVCNIMTQPGETDDYSVSHHLDAIEAHIGHHIFDYVIVNSGEIPPEVQLRYAEQGARPVRLDLAEVTRRGSRVIADHLVQYQTYLRHDAAKLSDHIYRLVEAWLLRKE